MTIELEKQGKRIYFTGNTFPIKDQIKALGGHWDTDRRAWWVGLGKADEAERLVAGAASAPPVPSGPGDDTRVKGKVRYKGRNYYVIAEGKERYRLTVLDGSIDFWVDRSECELVKTYYPREYRGRMEYTTLGSLRRFVESQRDAESRGEPACAACGKRGCLHHDLEDGMEKCWKCCDIPE